MARTGMSQKPRMSHLSNLHHQVFLLGIHGTEQATRHRAKILRSHQDANRNRSEGVQGGNPSLQHPAPTDIAQSHPPHIIFAPRAALADEATNVQDLALFLRHGALRAPAIMEAR